MPVISESSALELACKRLSRFDYVTIDTEFMRETTFYPKLCLIQLAGPEDAVIIDPLAPDLDLTPFLALMRDESITKVFHSGRQDIEILWHLDKCIPSPVFDTQIAAMVCGYGDSVSYEQLAHDLANAKIDKSSRFTDWSQRPLTEAQLIYAQSDVTYLRDVYKALLADLDKSGRRHWLDEEMLILTSPSTYELEPENAWQRLKGRVRKPKELAILIEVAALREREARSRDVPRGRVIKDDAIIDVATSAPRSIEALGRLRSIPSGFERSRIGSEIVECVERGLARDPKTLPLQGKSERKPYSGATVELLKVLLRLVSDNERVASKILSTVDDLEAIAADDNADVHALHGWRREVFGQSALDLKHGKLALAIIDGKVRAIQR
jgi:ribonuclease D